MNPIIPLLLASGYNPNDHTLIADNSNYAGRYGIGVTASGTNSPTSTAPQAEVSRLVFFCTGNWYY